MTYTVVVVLTAVRSGNFED